MNQKYGSTRWCKTGDSNDPTTGFGGGGVSGSTKCSRHDWWEVMTDVAGYSPEDPDWYSVDLTKGERLNVRLDDDRLGIEVHHGGQVVKRTRPSAENTTISFIADSNGTHYINITSAEYISLYDIRIQWISALGHDRFELNDQQSSAEPLHPGAGSNAIEYRDLTLAGDDEDYFSVYLEQGDTLNATLSHRDTGSPVRLEVVGPNGRVIEGSGSRIKSYAQYAELTAATDGDHYVRVSGGRNAALYYNITIQTDKASTAAGPGFGVFAAVFGLLLAVLAARYRS